VAKYIYYSCTRSRDRDCKCGYIREEDLVKQMIKIINDLDINEIELKKQFQEEVEKFNKFQSMVLQMNGKGKEIDKQKEFDIKTYAKYVLKEGSIDEKRELMASLKSRLVLAKRVLSLKK